MDLVYLDNNATTQPDPRVVEAMLPYLREAWANPSSVHRAGQRARAAVDEARGKVAALIGCAEAELIFTSGGTESINMAVRGLAAARGPRRRIVTTTVEHSATRQVCADLKARGAEIVEVAVDHEGNLDLDAFADALTEDTALATVMWANNETGVIFPVAQIARMCQARGVPFHCDATQAVGKIPVDVRDAGVDALTLAAHKFHGPKGAGALFVRRGLRVGALVAGGPQERGRRGGTENVPGIAGMGVAAQLAGAAVVQGERVAGLRDRLERGVLEGIEETAVNGTRDSRLPNTTNISFCRLEAEAILMLLSEQGICASAGAACASGSLEPSHVLQAMRIDPEMAHGAVRFSLSRFTTDEDVQRTLDVLPGVIARLRKVLPVA